MQTLLLSFENAAAREGASEGLALSLAGRRTDVITKAPQVGEEIIPPTLGTDEHGLPVTTVPGVYGPTTYPLEVNIYDNDPLPSWPAGATVATATSSLAFAPDEPRAQAQAPVSRPDESWKVVPLWKLRTVAEATGILQVVENMIENMPNGQEKIAARNAIQYAPEISIDGILLNALWPLTGLSQEDKENLFKAAHAIQA